MSDHAWVQGSLGEGCRWEGKHLTRAWISRGDEEIGIREHLPGPASVLPSGRPGVPPVSTCMERALSPRDRP